MSLKFIMASGIFIFVLMYAVSVGLKSNLRPNDSERVSPYRAKGKTDGVRAYADVVAQCALGARVCGSEGAKGAREYIRGELLKSGVSFEEVPFEVVDEGKVLKGSNIIAKVSGTSDGTVVLLGHYDTLDIGGGQHLGANTGASTVAILLELARALGMERKGRSIWLVFLDGHYRQKTQEEEIKGFFGGQAFAAWSQDKTNVEAVVSIEGLGDCYLRASLDKETPDWMAEIFRNTAERMGLARHLSKAWESHPSECTVFRNAGVPCAHLQDYSYGGSVMEHAKYWHSGQDTPEKVCPQSLQAVSDLLYDALATIDKRLDLMGRP